MSSVSYNMQSKRATLKRSDEAQASPTAALIGLAIGALLVIFIAAQMLPPLAGGLATAQANNSTVLLGLGGFMPILGIIFIAVIVLLAIRFIGQGGG